MWPDDLALFQYTKGILIGVMIGVALGYLFWRLPTVLKTRNTKKLRAIIMDLKRIEAGMVGNPAVLNQRELRVRRVPLRMRITEAWERFLEDTKPRTPYQVAEVTYKQVLGIL